MEVVRIGQVVGVVKALLVVRVGLIDGLGGCIGCWSRA